MIWRESLVGWLPPGIQPRRKEDPRVQPLDLLGQEQGESLLALDALDAGPGDQVLVTQDGWSAAWAIRRPGAAVDAAIIGIVDHVDLAK